MVIPDQVVCACQKKDHDAFHCLVDFYHKPIYNYAYQMTGNHCDAQDVTQETFLRVYTSIHLFRGNGTLTGWIYRIAGNICIDRARRQSRRPTSSLDVPVGDMEMSWQLPDESPGPDVETERQELGRLLRECLLELCVEHRTVVFFHDVRGLTYAEIARIMECPVGTVKSRLSRARARLRSILVARGVVTYGKVPAKMAVAV